MKKNKVIGLALIVVAGALAYLLTSACADAVEWLFGKALWYLPYVAAVCGVRRLVCTHG